MKQRDIRAQRKAQERRQLLKQHPSEEQRQREEFWASRELEVARESRSRIARECGPVNAGE